MLCDSENNCMQRRPFIAGLISIIFLLVGVVVYQAYLLHCLKPKTETVSFARTVSKAGSRTGVQVGVTPSPLLEESPDASGVPTGRFEWRNVESADYATYIQNLRAIGCPEETIRDIVIADVNKLYGSRRAALLTGAKPPEFWQTSEPLSEEQSSKRSEQLAALAREKTETIRSLLGIDPDTEKRKQEEGFTYTENRLGNLPPQKQDRVSLIREEFNERWQQVQAIADKAGTSPDQVSATLRQLDEERLAKLNQVLTPSELLEHELQTSWTAIQLRGELITFHPTETEFLRLYELQKDFDNEYVHYFHGRADEAALARKEQAQQKLNMQIRAALGDQRYEDYSGLRSGNQ